jgi:hypothetical protein
MEKEKEKYREEEIIHAEGRKKGKYIFYSYTQKPG